jgi:hypothetical protein
MWLEPEEGQALKLTKFTHSNADTSQILQVKFQQALWKEWRSMLLCIQVHLISYMQLHSTFLGSEHSLRFMK